MAHVKFKRFLSDGDLDNVDIEDGSFIVTKDGTSYADFLDERVAFGGTPDAEMSDESINSVQNKVVKQYIDVKNAQSVEKFGKTLWEGSFTSGELVVPGIHEYTMICVFIGSVMMMGNQLYGGLTYRTYQSTSVSHFGYRFTYDSANDKLKTDINNPGATDGSSQQTITKIVGVF